ncbi:MAG: hypothetical protein KGL39_50310 [Patescibacteria group bacterium]|nr:hypothetical protein [Patescibacteria group bacterium]
MQVARKFLALALMLVFGLSTGYIQPSSATVTTTNTVNNYTGNASQTVFSFTFQILQDVNGNPVTSTVIPYLAGVQQNSGFTVQANANQPSNPGGTVTFTTAPANAVAVQIRRNTGLTQTTTFALESKISTPALESALDKITMMVQENEYLLSQNITLPNPATGGALIGLNAAGSAVAQVAPNTIGYVVTDNGPGKPFTSQPVTAATGGNVVGPANSTSGHVATFADATGKTLSDGGTGGNVTGPGSSTSGHVATFADATGKTLSDGGSLALSFSESAKTGNFTAAVGNSYAVDISANSVVCTLPTAASVAGQMIVVWVSNNNGTTYNLAFNTTSAQTISGQASGAITTTVRYNAYWFVSDGANWIQL